MNKRVLLMMVFLLPWIISQPLPSERWNVYVTHTSSLFMSNTIGLNALDLKNTRAVHIEPNGRRGEWQELKNGRGVSNPLYGGLRGRTEVVLGWQHALDAEHWVADYGWMWTAASSNQSDIVQVFELRDGQVFITQQIEVDTHGSGGVAGAWFDTNKNVLTAKAVNYAPLEGRCCPSLLGVVTFRWDGKQFQRIRAKRVPLPKGSEDHVAITP